jgi:hypothetical protein
LHVATPPNLILERVSEVRTVALLPSDRKDEEMTYTYHPPSFTSHLDTVQPETIYHYTTQSGLLGIVQNRELWATKIHYMNDSTEFAFVFRMVADHLKMEEENAPADSERKLLASLMRTFADASKDVNVCVACFCYDRDLLSQWRGYAGGNYGYSIGFNTAEIKRLAAQADFLLGRCIYDRELQLRIVGEICNHYLQSSSRNTMEVINSFTVSIIQSGAFF